jgi:hypothetical protein
MITFIGIVVVVSVIAFLAFVVSSREREEQE